MQNQAAAHPATDRAARLKAETREVHERLDHAIMALDPFGSRDNYGRFLNVQWAFHAMIAPLYADDDLARLLPDLGERCRFASIEADLADLGMAAPATLSGSRPVAAHTAEALGWLYVAEGSNLGAAFLLKAAQKSLGLGEDFGARHLAGHPEGRALHWRQFTAALDAADLAPEDEEAVTVGARKAFAFVRAQVEAEASTAGLAARSSAGI
ncbi:biliverdin-producing heme oxygenase [Allorhizobium pseudoryzae]|uniref:biliverdin-producing heme oxygenase n=1 Tax=Allorhizobium pseudoryzae TaxID=379684 RepID=UPI003D02B057